MNEEKKQRLLQSMNFNDLGKFDKTETSVDLESKDINQLGDLLNNLTQKKLDKKDRKIVFDLIDILKNKVGSLSIEYLRYLMLTADRFKEYDAISILNTNYARAITKRQVSKVKKILREFSKEVKYIAAKKGYRELANINGSFVRVQKEKIFHFISL